MFRSAPLRRLATIPVIGSLIVAAFMVVTPAAASATTTHTCVNGHGATYGRWTNHHAYNFKPGGWCMLDDTMVYSRLVFQPDGNLVIYRATNWSATQWKAIGSSRTNGRGRELSFQTDSNVVIYGAHHKALWSTGRTKVMKSSSFTYYLYFYNDRNLTYPDLETIRANNRNSDDVKRYWSYRLPDIGPH